MTEAFLVLVLDTSASPPAVLGASVFSEDQPTLGMNRRCFTICRELAPTYDEASASLRHVVKHHLALAWVQPIFRERDGSNPFAPDEAQTSSRPITFGIDEVQVMCRNIGHDVTCGRCASVFFTGMALEDHDPGCKTPPPRVDLRGGPVSDAVQTIIDRARTLLAAATPGPLAVGVGQVQTEDAGRHRAVLVHTDAYCVAACGSPTDPHSHADAEVIAFAVNNIGTLCDAVVDAERRVEVLRDLADAAAAEQGLAQRRMVEAQEARDAALTERDAYRRAKAENDGRFMLERDTARAERDVALAQNRSAADLLAKVMRGDYAWTSGVAWAVGEAHRRLTDGPPDGVYVRTQGDEGDTRVSSEVEIETLRKELHGQKMLAESRWNECVDMSAENSRLQAELARLRAEKPRGDESLVKANALRVEDTEEG